MKIARVNEMRSMDRFAIEKLHISEEILMENAGLAVSFILNREIGIQKLLASGAILTSTEMALFELLKTSTDPKAKDLFRIIK